MKMAASPTNTKVAFRRAAQIASTNNIAVSVMVRLEGIATRKSAARKDPKQCTVPVIPFSAIAVTIAGNFASHGDAYPRARAAIAAGIINCVSGTTARLAGSPIVVAR